MWVKICGITDENTAAAVLQHAPDAIGLNFYRRSKRSVDVETARRIVQQMPADVLPVGLFVNHTADEIRTICDRCQISTVQLHGDETPEFAAGLRELQIIRAFRVGNEGLDELQAELRHYAQLDVKLWGALIDAKVGDAYGGTGHVAPWELLARKWLPAWPRMILAGGLHPANVAAAISQVHPWGVDVASGVEVEAGKKDPALVERFVQESRRVEG